MFDWFWEFLYRISASICKLIDTVMLCANKLCGIDPITVDGEDTDFITYLFESDEIRLAFSVAAIVGFILIVFFTIYAIIKAVASEKVEESNGRIVMKALKSILTLMAVPAIMLITMWCLNIIVDVMYEATLNGSSDGIGSFLIGAFSEEQVQLPSGTDYTDADNMWNFFNLKKYNYFFSWVASFIILFETAKSLIIFVDRAISIVVLFIVSPFSISASVVDDGAHFKLWREQVLVKFITGYGTIITLNIYALIVSLVARSDVVFFSNVFVNFVMKVLIIIGGAFSLQKVMGLIGNLVASGAGTQEMQQAAMANQGLGGLIKGAGGLAAKMTGLSAAKDIISGGFKGAKDKVAGKLTDKLTGDDKKNKEKSDKEEARNESNRQNLDEITRMLGGTPASAKNALSGDKDKKENDTKKDKNETAGAKEKSNGNHNNTLNNVISSGGKKKE